MGWRSIASCVCAVIGLGVAWSCPREPDYGTVAYRCDPRQGSGPCPDDFTCCSDDPIAAGHLPPNYDRDVAGGTPLFSFENNHVGTQAFCVRTGDIPPGFSLFEPPGCPIPCNPTWMPDWITDVCGGNTFKCCQTIPLHEDDCVLDEVTQFWRPANGDDALDSLAGGTRWRPTENSTHQDPDFTSCEALAGGDREDPRFVDCVGQLGVADQRGYCMSVPGCLMGTSPCDAMNG